MMIAFDGLDGAGKTTQAARLKARLEAQGREVLTLRLYEDDSVEQMLVRLDETTGIDNRSAHPLVMLAKLIARDEWLVRPAHERGAVIIYDKFLLTLLASEVLRGASVDDFAVAAGFIAPPDVLFTFTVDPVEALDRKGLPGYRESGLDLQEADGAMDLRRFLANDFEESWLRDRYIEFQNRLASSFREMAENEFVLVNILRGCAPIWVPPALGVEEVSELVDAELAHLPLMAPA